MKAAGFTDAQKGFVPKRIEESKMIVGMCQEVGTGQARFFDWKKQYAGLLPSDMRRLREPEDGNGRLTAFGIVGRFRDPTGLQGAAV